MSSFHHDLVNFLFGGLGDSCVFFYGVVFKFFLNFKNQKLQSYYKWSFKYYVPWRVNEEIDRKGIELFQTVWGSSNSFKNLIYASVHRFTVISFSDGIDLACFYHIVNLNVRSHLRELLKFICYRNAFLNSAVFSIFYKSLISCAQVFRLLSSFTVFANLSWSPTSALCRVRVTFQRQTFIDFYQSEFQVYTK